MERMTSIAHELPQYRITVHVLFNQKALICCLTVSSRSLYRT